MSFWKTAFIARDLLNGPAGRKELAELARLVDERPELIRFVLSEVTSAAWFTSLGEAGWFDEPLEGTFFPQCQAILRVSESRPDAVAGALLAVPVHDDPYAVALLARAAAKADAQTRHQWIGRWLPWLEHLEELDAAGRPLVSLALMLIEEDSPLVVPVLEVLLSPVPGTEPVMVIDCAPTRLDAFWYSEAVKALGEKLLAKPERALPTVLRLLDQLIEASRPEGRVGDGSGYWFRQTRYRSHDPRASLATLARRLAQQWWSGAGWSGQVAIVAALSGFRWPVGKTLLKRIVLDDPDAPTAVLVSLAEQPEVWSAWVLRDLDWRILQAAAHRRGGRALLERVLRGPSLALRGEWQRRFESESDREGVAEAWLQSRLSAFPPKWLPQGMVAPPPAEDSFLDAVVTIEEDVDFQFSGLEPDSIVHRAEERGDASLGAALYALHSEHLKDMSDGDLARVLELCVRGARSREREAVRWGIRLVDELLRRGKDDAVRLPKHLAPIAWLAIEAAGEHTDPTGPVSPVEPFQAAINAPRTLAIEAAVRFGLWLRRQSPDGWTFERYPEIRTFLESQLDIASASDAVHAMLGNWLPWLVVLDKAWVADHRDALLPSDEDRRWLFEAAWQAYLRHPCYNDVFDMFEDRYQLAIEHIASDKEGRDAEDSADAGLARHLMARYWRSQLELDTPMLRAFYERAPASLRAYALEFVGRALSNTTADQLSERVVARIRMLWEHRLDAAGGSHSAEVAAFGHWVDLVHLPEEWRLTQLATVAHMGPVERPYGVQEFLAEAAPGHPALVLEIFRALLKTDQRYRWASYATPILEAGLAHRKTRMATKRLIDELGEQGHLQYGALLE